MRERKKRALINVPAFPVRYHLTFSLTYYLSCYCLSVNDSAAAAAAAASSSFYIYNVFVILNTRSVSRQSKLPDVVYHRA
jgi:hypothetical protein